MYHGELPRDWDEHYANLPTLDFTPARLVVEAAEPLPPGRALDIACGPGRHALYLAVLGWQVTAVDKSARAISILRERAAVLDVSSGGQVDARMADLEAGGFRIAPESYELIVDILYLQRDLFPAMREGLAVGGMFAGAIRLFDESEGPMAHPEFRMQAGELRAEFSGWKIVYYSEAAEPGHSHRTARILARKA
jgi:tellurite methyltransferase